MRLYNVQDGQWTLDWWGIQTCNYVRQIYLWGLRILYTRGKERNRNHQSHHIFFACVWYVKSNNSASRYRFLVWVACHKHSRFVGFFRYSIDVIWRLLNSTRRHIMFKKYISVLGSWAGVTKLKAARSSPRLRISGHRFWPWDQANLCRGTTTAK